MKKILCLLFLLGCGQFGVAQQCSDYNTSVGPINYGTTDSQQHATGVHSFAHAAKGSCTYSGTGSYYGPVGCTLTAQANSYSGAGDDGTLQLQYALDTHNASYKDAQGGASGVNGADAKADSEGVGTVQSCVGSCSTNISISGTGNGSGFTVSFSPTPLWQDNYHYVVNCPGETLPDLSKCPSPTTPYPGQSTQNGWYTWDPAACQWVWVNCASDGQNCSPGGSPVVIDTLNKGFDFTDPTKGEYVSFDLRGDGTVGHYSWPKHGSGNAWLVYDNGDGIIRDGKQLFGNFTPHSDGGIVNNQYANGFLALAWYDWPAQGGNLDALIDKKDAVWQHLKLWTDEHCYLSPDTPCQSRPSELHDLDALGIHSLSLVYNPSPKIDSVGNKYKYNAVVNPDIHDAPVNKNGEHADSQGRPCCDLHQRSKDGRLMYDVWLRAVP